MLAVGERAPDFEADSSAGHRIRLSSLRGGPVILYFFPRAGTPGCTAESLGFADHYPEFHSRGVRVVGISVDDVDDQEAFARKCSVPFPLVADADKSIARAYGVLGMFGFAKRVTFVIDADGRVEDVIESVWPGRHVARAREKIVGGSPAGTTPPDQSRS